MRKYIKPVSKIYGVMLTQMVAESVNSISSTQASKGERGNVVNLGKEESLFGESSSSSIWGEEE